MSRRVNQSRGNDRKENCPEGSQVHHEGSCADRSSRPNQPRVIGRDEDHLKSDDTCANREHGRKENCLDGSQDYRLSRFNRSREHVRGEGCFDGTKDYRSSRFNESREHDGKEDFLDVDDSWDNRSSRLYQSREHGRGENSLDGSQDYRASKLQRQEEGDQAELVSFGDQRSKHEWRSNTLNCKGDIRSKMPRPMTYGRLKVWANLKDPRELALFMANEIEQIKEFLMTDNINEDQFSLFIHAMGNATTSKQNAAVKKILDCVCQTPFLEKHLTAFVLGKMESENSKERKSILESMICILENLLNHCPLHAVKCISAIPQLRTVNGFSEWTDIAEKMIEVEKKAKQTFISTRNKSKELPPDDFLESSVLPTTEDLKEDVKVFLRPAKVEGGYDDTKHYLDVQFRLLKQDFIIPLREGIAEFKKSGFKKNFKTQHIRLYFHVHILGIVTQDFIDHVVQFDVSNLKAVKWELSKRFMGGSLLCFSKDGFETFAIATVANRDQEDLKKGFVNVNFKAGFDLVFNSTSNDEFVMAETVAYYESYCHVLEGLQEMVDNLPLQEYIVKCEKKVKPPQYLLHMPDLSYDLSPLMKKIRIPKLVPVLLTKEWPQTELMTLNESQREAAQMALTKNLAVIQGPPGTGKTYVGLKVVQTLLKNINETQLDIIGASSSQKQGNPILVVCFTNHALDQFLEGILNFCPKGIVRVGGRSKSEKLKVYTLKEIQKTKVPEITVLKARKERQKSLKEVADRIDYASKKLESSCFRIFSQKSLEGCMKENHFTSLISMKSNFMGRGNIISQWLNARVEDPERAVNEIIDNALTRLILCCKVKKNSHHNLNKNMTIQDKASLYMFFVQDLRALLRKEKYELQFIRDHPSVKRKIETVNQTLEISFNQVLPDHIMKQAVPKDYLIKLHEICRKAGIVVPNETFKAWLGFFDIEHVKLDSIEQLQNLFSGLETEQTHDIKDDKPDIFVEEEEASDTYKQQAKSLKNSLTSKVHRIFALGLDDRETDKDASNERWLKAGKLLGFSQITKKLKKVKPMTEANEEKIKNVWALGFNDRFALYKLWVERYKLVVIDEMQKHVREYNSCQAALQEIKDYETGCILREANVIGMTTTGAAKHRSVLQDVGCKIIVVEEAAEVLEAHIVTALNKHCEHLILIGDHQQLRPNPCVYELAKKFGMEISLFERLVKNQFPHKVLLEQHRMRPLISKIMRHIYPDLQDHPVVQSYDHIKGVAKDVYFIQHEELESNLVDSYSKANDFEANYVARLCQYLLLQGYEPKQITILATYAGQVTNIHTRVREDSMESEVRITAVDNFQGEENDIIILSLVRSNEEDNVGFLKVSNRVCVALSRAKMGLYIVGNFKQFSSQSKLWKSIIQTAETEEIFGGGLPVVCPNHPDKDQMMMYRDTDFDKRPEGGCGVACGAKLDCGHICALKCHGYDPNHDEYRCKKPCTKSCKLGHPCKRNCYQECGDCQFKIKKVIPSCGHEDYVPCYVPPDKAVCSQPCKKILDCGHECDGQCGHCRIAEEHNKCKTVVEHTWPCGHQVPVKCYKKHLPCPHPCNTQLDCGHKCKGSCSTCLQGKVHQACRERCQKKLLCGHLCKDRCSQPCSPCKELCPFSCRHASCIRRGVEHSPECGHMCPPCKERCLRNCPCRIKFDACNKLCSEECYNIPCKKACQRTLKCGHRCRGICGELCVCIECKTIETLSKNFEVKPDVDEDIEPISVGFPKLSRNEGRQNFKTWQEQYLSKPLLILVPTCNHVFYIEDLDKYVAQFEPGGSSYIPCPKCKHPIQKCTRYETENQERAEKRCKLKELMKKDNFIAPELIFRLETSKALLQNSNLMAEFIAPKIDKDINKSKMEALSFRLKLAFVLCQISSFKFKTVHTPAFEEMLSSRKSALLKINDYVTQQQKWEFIIDFVHCMWQAAMDKIKDISGDASNISITDSGLTAGSREGTDAYVDRAKSEIDAAIVESKKIIGQNMLAAAQLKLIQETIHRAAKVLKSKDAELLQDIIGNPTRSPSTPKSSHSSQRDKTVNKRASHVLTTTLDKKYEQLCSAGGKIRNPMVRAEVSDSQAVNPAYREESLPLGLRSSGERDNSARPSSAIRKNIKGAQDSGVPLAGYYGSEKKSLAMTREKMMLSAKAIVGEYLNIHDLKDAKSYVMELKGQKYLHTFITGSIESVLEGTNGDQKATGQLLSEIMKDNIISLDDYLDGLFEFLQCAEDMVFDIPKLWTNLAQVITPVLVEGCMPWSELEKPLTLTLSSNSCAKLLVEILLTARSMVSDAEVVRMWRLSGIEWETFLPAEDVTGFIQDNKLEFLMRPTDDSTQSAMNLVCDDFVKIIKDSKSSNDINSFIMAKVPTDKQDKSFVRQLMTAFCMASLSANMKFSQDIIKKRQAILQKYIKGTDMELQALFAVQAFIHRLDHPRFIISEVFETLYNEELINEEAFLQWEVSTEEPEGKGACLVAVQRFLTWLRESVDES